VQNPYTQRQTTEVELYRGHQIEGFNQLKQTVHNAGIGREGLHDPEAYQREIDLTSEEALEEEYDSLTEMKKDEVDCLEEECHTVDGETNWRPEEHESDTESQLDEQEDLNTRQWMEQAELEAKALRQQWQQVRKEENEEESLEEPIDLVMPNVGEEEEVAGLEKPCKHNSYDLDTYEMVETVGWSWMIGDTTEKECIQCQEPKKLSGRNPMYYCRSCYSHGICNDCWSSLILCENRSGRGHRQRQCQKEKGEEKRIDSILKSPSTIETKADESVVKKGMQVKTGSWTTHWTQPFQM
jgi:hypothetical protein